MDLAADAALRPPALPELARVRLLTTLESEDGVFPAGSEGTIVLVHGSGEAYEIEFSAPREGLVTAYAKDVQALPGR